MESPNCAEAFVGRWLSKARFISTILLLLQTVFDKMPGLWQKTHFPFGFAAWMTRFFAPPLPLSFPQFAFLLYYSPFFLRTSGSGNTKAEGAGDSGPTEVETRKPKDLEIIDSGKVDPKPKSEPAVKEALPKAKVLVKAKPMPSKGSVARQRKKKEAARSSAGPREPVSVKSGGMTCQGSPHHRRPWTRRCGELHRRRRQFRSRSRAAKSIFLSLQLL